MLSRTLYALLVAIFLYVSAPAIGGAEIKKASVPSLKANPSLNSVMNKSLKVFVGTTPLKTNGEIVKEEDGNIVAVDNIEEPKCVFYGNYNDSDGDNISQEFLIKSLTFKCD
ncbi:MAG: hypothetical protein WGN25_16990 [Candidatus Electrothrix sp. GW3-4]|uniref:hypothetical protein n=1 Tax=Candidatus Electrothrix sp. GW3-4 TaxID=3126740 RepID=UPI0030D42694